LSPFRTAVLRLLLCLPALLPSACFIPLVSPPSRMDFGAAHDFGADDLTAFHYAIGLHTGSLDPEAFPKSDVFDLGAGFVIDADANGARSKGFYGGVDWFPVRRTSVRLGTGIRGEALTKGPNWGSGAFARLSGELFMSGHGTGSGCSFMLWRGAVGTAIFVEAGGQHLADGRDAFVATAGLSLRLPAMVGLLSTRC